MATGKNKYDLPNSKERNKPELLERLGRLKGIKKHIEELSYGSFEISEKLDDKGNLIGIEIILYTVDDEVTLEKFILVNKKNPQALEEVAGKFLEMIKELHSKEISHGDLNPQNIIIEGVQGNYSIKLSINPDFLYIPGLELEKEEEETRGTVGYQHSSRLDAPITYKNSKTDYYSELVIYGLLCPNNQQLTDILVDYNNEKDYSNLVPFYIDSRFVLPSPQKEEEKPIEATLSSTEEKQTKNLKITYYYIFLLSIIIVILMTTILWGTKKNRQKQPVEPTKASSLSAQEFVTPTAVSPIENPIEKVVATPKEEKPTEEKIIAKPIEKPKEEKPTEEKIIAKPIEKPKEEKSTEEKIIAKPIEDKPIAKSIEEKIVEKKGEDKIETKSFSSKYDKVREFSEGLAVVELDGLYGIIDKNGKEIVPALYQEIKDFSEGLAVVKLNDKYGFINRAGKLVIPLKYNSAESFSNGKAYVKYANKNMYISVAGKEYEQIGDFSEGLAVVESDGKYGFIDKTGKEVIPLKYDDAEEFYKGTAIITWKEKKGLIDRMGRGLTAPKYNRLYRKYGDYDFMEGVIYHSGMIIGTDYYYISLKGKEYDYIERYQKGYSNLYRARNKYKYGLIDKEGNEMTAIKYDKLFDEFEDGLLGVKLNGKYGAIDPKGKEIIPLKYDYIKIVSSKEIVVSVNGKTFTINASGKCIKDCGNFEYVIYQLEKGEGFYNLERKFNITEEELLKVNPELKDKKIDNTTQIWIPKEKYIQWYQQQQ